MKGGGEWSNLSKIIPIFKPKIFFFKAKQKKKILSVLRLISIFPMIFFYQHLNHWGWGLGVTSKLDFLYE